MEAGSQGRRHGHFPKGPVGAGLLLLPIASARRRVPSFKDQFTGIRRRLGHEIRSPIYLHLQINSAVCGLTFEGCCQQNILFIFANFIKTLYSSKELIKFMSKQFMTKCLIPLIKCKLCRERAPVCFALSSANIETHPSIYT